MYKGARFQNGMVGAAMVGAESRGSRVVVTVAFTGGDVGGILHQQTNWFLGNVTIREVSEEKVVEEW